MQGGIPFVNHEESGHDELAGASPVAHNVVLDEKGSVRRRPGIVQYTTAAFNADGTAVQWVHRAFDNDLYCITGPEGSTARNLYRMAGVGAGSVTLGPIIATGRVQHVETEGLIALATGGVPYRVRLSDKTLAVLGGSPPRATHILGNSARLVTNDLDQLWAIRWSDVQAGATPITGHETWPADYLLGADGRPDRVLAIGENTNEVFAWGETSLQVFAPDDATTYAPVAAREYGTCAPHSVIKRDQSFAWLDHRRRFVVSDGRAFEVISQSIQKSLEELTTPADCFGYWLSMGAADCLVWTFPTDGVTWVYQGGTWGRWTGWDGSQWQRFMVNSYHQRTDDNTPMVGTTTGRIGKMSWDASTDLGVAIRAYVQTGYMDRGTDKRKQCTGIRLALKRGQTTKANSPKLMVGYRDQPGDWRLLEVDLGASGDTDIVVTLTSLGTYRRRQWYFDFSGSDDFALVRATEEFTILEY